MDALFLNVLNRSITAGWLILAVLVLRFALKKAPRWISCLLWALVAIRLVCPFSIESAMSLIPEEAPLPERILSGPGVSVTAQIPMADAPVNEVVGGQHPKETPVAADNGPLIMGTLGIIWIWGVALFFFYGFISYAGLSRRTGVSVYICGNILKCDGIDTPFILGILRPRIYLPSDMEETQTEYVIAHEKAHIRRHDHWWKPIGFLILCVYWFHPLCWISYILLCRDIELACDEHVVKNMNLDSKKSYAEALLSCSIRQKAISACPLAFGEVGVKERIRSVLNYKKPAFWIILAGAAGCILVAVCFLTDPEKKDPLQIEESGYVMPGVDVPEEVLAEAKQYVDTRYRQVQESTLNYDYTNWRIEHLEYSYTYNNPEGRMYEIYQLNYEFLSSSPEDVILSGGMTISEEGWVVPEYPDAAYLIFSKEGNKLHFLSVMTENDCYPGDEVFTKELQAVIREADSANASTYATDEAKAELLSQTLSDWAHAFIDRDGKSIVNLASSKLAEDFYDQDLLMGSEGQYSFGFSSPWPWFPETDFMIYRQEDSEAEIYYYARTSDPHITYWREILNYEWQEDGYVITGEQLTYFDSISTGAEFEEAYHGFIDGTMIDYTQNQLGETLNENALLSSNNAYQALFSPESAAVFLLNLSEHTDEVQITRRGIRTNGQVELDITFLKDQVTVPVCMIQPYGENGIWVPVDYQVDVIARFMDVDWSEVERIPYTGDIPDLTGIACIGEIPKEDIRVYGYNDEDITGRGVAVCIAGDVNYFDWQYISPRVVLPDLFWDEEQRTLQISFHTNTGTGMDAEDLYVLRQYDTGTLYPFWFNQMTYSAILEERIGYTFDEENGILTLTNRKTKEELANVQIPEGKVTGLELGSISGFKPGKTILFHVKPGYYVDDSVIAQYEDMPTLEFEVVIGFTENDEMTFDLGEV